MSQAPIDDHCRCGLRVVERTSWTDGNPGRRFVSCPYSRNGGCRVFAWTDPPICARARTLIPALLRKYNNSQANNVKLKKENNRLVRSMVMTWILIVVLLLAQALYFCRFGAVDKEAGLLGVKKMLP